MGKETGAAEMTTFQTLPATESWATAGAMAIVSNIPGCIPVIHAGPGCGFSMAWGAFMASGQQSVPGTTGWAFPTTTLTEKDTIFGGEDKLYKLLTGPWHKMFNRPDTIFVCSGCIPDIIGDDVERVVQRAQPHLNDIKAVYAYAGGFKGTSSDGANMALETIVKQIVLPPKRKRPNSVNIFGIVPYFDPYWYGDMAEILRIVGRLGLEVVSAIPGQYPRAALESMSEASLNIVLSDKIGLEAAEYLREEYGTPYVYANRGMPIGTDATNDLVLSIGASLDMALGPIKYVVDDETEYVYRRMTQGLLSYMIKQNSNYVLVAPSAYSIGYFRFLTGELGWYPSLIGLTYAGNESVEVLGSFAKELIPSAEFVTMVAPSNFDFEKALLGADPRPEFLFGRTIDKYANAQVRAAHLPIAWPIMDQLIIDKSYLGYRGSIRLFEDMYSVAGSWFG